MNQLQVPDDFPRIPLLGTVPRIRPELVFIKISTCSAALSDHELRYLRCEDFARQMEIGTFREIMKQRWSMQTALSNVEACVTEAIRRSGWELTDAEIAWTVDRTRMLLSTATAGDKSLEPDSNLPSHSGNDNYGE